MHSSALTSLLARMVDTRKRGQRRKGENYNDLIAHGTLAEAADGYDAPARASGETEARPAGRKRRSLPKGTPSTRPAVRRQRSPAPRGTPAPAATKRRTSARAASVQASSEATAPSPSALAPAWAADPVTADVRAADRSASAPAPAPAASGDKKGAG